MDIQASNEWLSVISMTDAMRRYAEQQQWDEVSSLAVQRQAQLQLFFSKLGTVTTAERESIVQHVQQLMAADKLLVSAATEMKAAMAEGLAQINQGRKAVSSYQGCSDTF
jgi:tRNA U34 5-carboxymethylaminomethyl modifying enzyme MnmG/GidA